MSKWKAFIVGKGGAEVAIDHINADSQAAAQATTFTNLTVRGDLPIIKATWQAQGMPVKEVQK